MAKAGKIEQLNLGPRIMDLIGQGLGTHDIAAKLRAEGIKISQPTVSRWVKDAREKSQAKAEKIFSDHVERELPKDLEALEQMEKFCLAWMAEEAGEKVKRISSWRRVNDSLEEFARLLQFVPSDKERSAHVKTIIQKIMGWLVEDINQQKQRIGAMKMATGIIEVKLRNAGLLGDSEKGRIVIKPYDNSKPLDEAAGEKKNVRHLFSVAGIQKDS
jgi:hypothetical protein